MNKLSCAHVVSCDHERSFIHIGNEARLTIWERGKFIGLCKKNLHFNLFYLKGTVVTPFCWLNDDTKLCQIEFFGSEDTYQLWRPEGRNQRSSWGITKIFLILKKDFFLVLFPHFPLWGELKPKFTGN